MITGYIRGQKLELYQPTVAADTINYLTARFYFQTNEWNGLIKFAHFVSGAYSAHVELTDDEIPDTAGLNLTAGKWTVSVTGHAYDGETLTKRATTSTAELSVVPTGDEGGEPLPVSPSAGEEILGKVENIEASVEAQLEAQDSAVEKQLSDQDDAVAARLGENEAAVARMLGAVKNQRDNSFLKVWAGTEEQYGAAEKSADTVYLIGFGLVGGDSD